MQPVWIVPFLQERHAGKMESSESIQNPRPMEIENKVFLIARACYNRLEHRRLK